jgi:23S rRNA (adenine2503-C2)-methyltransferase
MWNTIEKIQSSDANVAKFIYKKDDAVAESVLYKYPTYADRTVICFSTQSGCPIGCRFCGAGDNFVRSLTAEEIVAQVDECLNNTGISPYEIKHLQLMGMSMGEPLMNRKGVTAALIMLHKKYPHAALLISTSAPDVDYSWFRDLSKDIPKIGLQFSVHESTDEARNKLIPFKAKLTLEEIAQEGNLWYNKTKRQPFFNYCAHANNTSQEDVERLVKLFNPEIWQSTISVVCERDESIAEANQRQRQLATDFMEKMMQAGYSTRCFDPAGQDDIGGGCGMLHQFQKWVKENPNLAKPSVGRNIPIVHMPT